MARDSTVTTYIDGDISGLRRATREASREFTNVSRAAAKANTDAARGSTKALAGVTRLVATGKVTVKSIDKIGRSASDAISAASGFAGGIGAALGLVALPALSVAAVKAIGYIREANKSLADRINDAAAAQRNLTLAQINARGSQEGLTQAQSIAITAQQKLDRARLNSNHTTEYMQRLERDAANAHDAVTAAQITLSDSIGKSDAASKKFAGTLQKEASKAIREFTIGTVEYDSQGVNYVKTTTDMAAASESYAAKLREHAGATKGLTRDQKLLELSLANYVETTQTVPDDIATVVQLLGQGKSVKQIQEYLGLIDAVPATAKTKVSLPGVNRALGDAKGLYGALVRLDGKTVTTKIINITVKRSEREGDAAGGARIAGRFDGKDDVPVNVSKGEVILNPRQQRAVDSGASINSALAGAPTIRAGGGFAKGGRRDDRSMDQFLGSSILDRLALASSTLTDTDDRSAAAFARDRVERILKSGKLGKRKLSVTERRMLLEALGGFRRDALAPDLGGGGGDLGGGGGAGADPFAVERARQAGVTEGRGIANAYVFGGSGDIGSGGANAIMAAGSVHFENVSFTNSVQNTAAFAQASNVGNDLISGGRIRSSRQTVAFGG